MKRLNDPSIDIDGFRIDRFDAIDDPAYRAKVEEVYGRFEPGKNAINQLCRGTAWGAYLDNQFVWSDRTTYSLPAHLQPEEGNSIREFSKIPKSFLTHPVTETALRHSFAVWNHAVQSDQQLYQVQLSAIRYQPTVAKPALPSPIEPHQDLVDGTIIVLNKRGPMAGGVSRLYALDGTPLFELDLAVGEGLSIRDAALKHQVTIMTLDTDAGWRPGDSAVRDVLLVRFQAVGR